MLVEIPVNVPITVDQSDKNEEYNAIFIAFCFAFICLVAYFVYKVVYNKGIKEISDSQKLESDTRELEEPEGDLGKPESQQPKKYDLYENKLIFIKDANDIKALINHYKYMINSPVDKIDINEVFKWYRVYDSIFNIYVGSKNEVGWVFYINKVECNISEFSKIFKKMRNVIFIKMLNDFLHDKNLNDSKIISKSNKVINFICPMVAELVYSVLFGRFNSDATDIVLNGALMGSISDYYDAGGIDGVLLFLFSLQYDGFGGLYEIYSKCCAGDHSGVNSSFQEQVSPGDLKFQTYENYDAYMLGFADLLQLSLSKLSNIKHPGLHKYDKSIFNIDFKNVLELKVNDNITVPIDNEVLGKYRYMMNNIDDFDSSKLIIDKDLYKLINDQIDKVYNKHYTSDFMDETKKQEANVYVKYMKENQDYIFIKVINKLHSSKFDFGDNEYNYLLEHLTHVIVKNIFYSFVSLINNITHSHGLGENKTRELFNKYDKIGGFDSLLILVESMSKRISNSRFVGVDLLAVSDKVDVIFEKVTKSQNHDEYLSNLKDAFAVCHESVSDQGEYEGKKNNMDYSYYYSLDIEFFESCLNRNDNLIFDNISTNKISKMRSMIKSCALRDREICDLYFMCAERILKKLDIMKIDGRYIDKSLFEIFIKILSNNGVEDINSYDKLNLIIEQTIKEIKDLIDNFQNGMRYNMYTNNYERLDKYFKIGGLDYVLIICMSFENRTKLKGARDFYGINSIFFGIDDKVDKLNKSMSNFLGASKYEEYIKYVKDSLILGMSSMSQYSIDDISKRPENYAEQIGIRFESLDEAQKTEYNKGFGVKADEIIKNSNLF